MIKQAAPTQTEEEELIPQEEDKSIPKFGTLEWIYYWSETEGELPSPIEVSITGSQLYQCPDLVWYNFDVYPHKVKLTNTGYTVLLGAKWRTERPYLEGGPFFEKHILSQIHFHWGSNMMEGSEHTVDKRSYPGEMQINIGKMPQPKLMFEISITIYSHVKLMIDTNRDLNWQPLGNVYFNFVSGPDFYPYRSEYMTQEEALKHNDGVVVICYIIKYGVNPDLHLQWVIEGFPRIQEAQTNTRIGPYPMSRLLPMFFEDYFLYWGSLTTAKGESHVVRWLIPRATIYASFEQMKQFRKLWNPWDEPNLRNFRPLQDRSDRHIWFISPHWCQYNSLLPIPRIPEPSISILSPAYQANPWMLPKQNNNLLIQPEEDDVHK